MPADLLTLDPEAVRRLLSAAPPELTFDKPAPRVTYTPPDWMSGRKAADHTIDWGSKLKDAVTEGDLKGVAGAMFTAPLNFADFLPSPDEISAGEDDLVRMGYQDENSAKWKKRLSGAVRGTADLTSNVFLAPGNVGLGAGMSALGRVAQTAANPLTRGIAGLTKAAATGKFAVDAGMGVVDSGQHFADAQASGDDVGMGEAAAQGIGNTAMLAGTGMHAVREGVHATQEMLSASPELQKVHAQITALVNSPGQMQTAMNSIVTAMAANGGDVAAAAAPVIRSLYHWSDAPRETVDPKNFGKGKPGGEQRRQQNDPQNFVDRTSAWDTPEANEKGFGPGSSRPYRHEIRLPDEKLYDIIADPEGIRAKAGDFTLAEKAAKEAGYSGFFATDGSGVKQYALFNAETPVEIAKVNSYDQPPEIIKPLQPEQVPQAEPAPPSPEMQLARQIVEAHNKNGGSSFHLQNGDLSGSNKYMVSVFPEASEILDQSPTAEQIAAYIEKHRQTLQDPNVAIGTWADEGKHYLDLSAALDDRGPSEHLGQKYNQKGIGQLIPDGFDYIPTGGTGEGVGFEAPAMHERLARELELYKQSQQPAVVEAPPAEVPAEEPLQLPKFSVPAYSSTKWMEKPLKVTGTGETKTPLVEDVGRSFQDLVSGKKGSIASRGGDAEADRVARAMKEAPAELAHQLAKGDSGKGWYKRTLDRASQMWQEDHPELQDPVKMTIFKSVVAATSPQQNPLDNTVSAKRAWTHYQKKGRIEAYDEAGAQFNVTTSPLENLSKLVAAKGEEGAAKWLLEKHSIAELQEWNSAVGSQLGFKKEGEAYGTYILGPKAGAFAANLNGIHTELTMDTWWSRTWNRWMGTMFTPAGMIASPRSGMERDAMRSATRKLGAKFGLDVDEVQAVLWYYEQALYRAHGIHSESLDYEQAAKQLRSKPNGADSGETREGGKTPEPGGADEGDRADSGAVEDELPDWVTEEFEEPEPPSKPPAAHPALKKKKAQ